MWLQYFIQSIAFIMVIKANSTHKQSLNTHLPHQCPFLWDFPLTQCLSRTILFFLSLIPTQICSLGIQYQVCILTGNTHTYLSVGRGRLQRPRAKWLPDTAYKLTRPHRLLYTLDSVMHPPTRTPTHILPEVPTRSASLCASKIHNKQ